MIKDLVTIAIPTYSRLNYLKQAVYSALNQSYQNLEILIGDDGNSSAIQEWCEQIILSDSRIRYQKNRRNLGLAGNWNALARSASGKYIVIIGDDDRLLPTFVEKLTNHLVDGIEVVFCSQFIINSDGDILEKESDACNLRYARKELHWGKLIAPELAVWNNTVPMSAALILRQKILEFPFSEELNTPEIELFLKMANSGSGFSFESESLAEYRVHAASETSSGLRNDRLAKRLCGIAVSQEAESAKRRFLEPLVRSAVSICLAEGRSKEARQWLASDYYPPESVWTGRGIFQRICSLLPGKVSVKLIDCFKKSRAYLR